MNKTWVIVLIVVVAGLGLWWLMRGGSPSGYGSPVVSYSPAPSSVSANATPTPAGYVAKPTPGLTSTMSYSQLVAAYGANRIQFDNNCQAQPRTVSYKNGTSILLDNRANQARVITVGGTKYNLGPYGYEVITLSGSVPQKLGLNCNSLVNVGTVNLEADISGQ